MSGFDCGIRDDRPQCRNSENLCGHHKHHDWQGKGCDWCGVAEVSLTEAKAAALREAATDWLAVEWQSVPKNYVYQWLRKRAAELDRSDS